MKIGCPCGEVIRDQTDYLACKAQFLADRDSEDFDAQLLAVVERARRDDRPARDLLSYLWDHDLFLRRVYQCLSCGRVCFEHGGELAWFTPEPPNHVARVLDSSLGAAWPRTLHARWDSTKGRGEFYVDDTDVDPGSFVDVASWEELETIYREKFEALSKLGHLRQAFLAKDGVTVHSWRKESGHN